MANTVGDEATRRSRHRVTRTVSVEQWATSWAVEEGRTGIRANAGEDKVTSCNYLCVHERSTRFVLLSTTQLLRYPALRLDIHLYNLRLWSLFGVRPSIIPCNTGHVIEQVTPGIASCLPLHVN